MKKLGFSIILFAILAGIPLYAQEIQGTQSTFYYVDMPIERIYSHMRGFAILYRGQDWELEWAYLPIEWLSPSGEAEERQAPKIDLVNLAPGNVWPHLTIFYKEGVFDHVRLYVRPERGHSSWGFIERDIDLDDVFQEVLDADDLRLTFQLPGQ
ncbi:MAG: hypothetical protein LBQ77_00885 [Treponema sp.]|jgi:hypothetical protein|nr:hypothetical protein [Treponema sp.]